MKRKRKQQSPVELLEIMFQCGGCKNIFWAKREPKKCPHCGMAKRGPHALR